MEIIHGYSFLIRGSPGSFLPSGRWNTNGPGNRRSEPTQSTNQGRENRVASHGCPVAFSRRILKALRLPWQPTTTAARCNYLKNARRSPIPLAPPPPPPLRGLLVQDDAKVAAVFRVTANRRYHRIAPFFSSLRPGIISTSFQESCIFFSRPNEQLRHEKRESLFPFPLHLKSLNEILGDLEKCETADIFTKHYSRNILDLVRFLLRGMAANHAAICSAITEWRTPIKMPAIKEQDFKWLSRVCSLARIVIR